MKILTKLALLAMFVLPCIRPVGAAECTMFDSNQIDVLQSAYDYGSDHNMGWTMAAIAWKESSAGKRLANWDDPSFGVYHVLLKNAAHSEGVNIRTEPLKALSIAARLMYDQDYGAQESLTVLKFWHKQHKGDWFKTWASYNRGNNWSGVTGTMYAYDIQSKIKYLKLNNCLVR